MARRPQGVVYIRQEVAVELPWYRFEAGWQPNPADPSRFEDSSWNDIEAAFGWARARAPRVHLRLARGYYAAGVDDWPRRDPRWPGATRRRRRTGHARYGGVVYVNEVSPHFWGREHYSALWESTRGTLLGRRLVSFAGRGGFRDLEVAIDWGIERAPVVLVMLASEAPDRSPVYERWSAGDEEPIGEDLPRLRPRPPAATMQWTYESSLWTDTFNDFDTEPRWRSIQEGLTALRADPRALSPTVDRKGGIVRFRVDAPTRTDAEHLARDVWLDAALEPTDTDSVWLMPVGAVRPAPGAEGSTR